MDGAPPAPAEGVTNAGVGSGSCSARSSVGRNGIEQDDEQSSNRPDEEGGDPPASFGPPLVLGKASIDKRKRKPSDSVTRLVLHDHGGRRARRLCRTSRRSALLTRARLLAAGVTEESVIGCAQVLVRHLLHFIQKPPTLPSFTLRVTNASSLPSAKLSFQSVTR